MKKGVLIILGMFMMVSTVEAKNGNELRNSIGVNYSYNNAVNFIERGVEFFIFTNGEFDFNTNYNTTYYDYNGRRVTNRGVKIERDYRGRVRSIGNVFINYNAFGNVTRIGNVYMRYYRGKLTNVGNLQVKYNRWGNPNYYGEVKYNDGFNINLNFGPIFDYNNAYFYRNDFRHNYSKIREDNNYYYYKAKPNAKIGTHSKMLKRRKISSTITKRKSTIDKKRSNNSYRRPTSLNSKRKVILETRSNAFSNRRTATNKTKNTDTKNKNARKRKS